MNIILCGLPMCGKSTIGKLLGHATNRQFFDTDQLIKKAYAAHSNKKLSCRQIFIEEGEEFFRDFETKQIAMMKHTKDSIISIGGGTLCEPRNKETLVALGKIIYLKASANMLWQRTQQQGIPAYLDQKDPETAFHALVIKRIPLYEKAANWMIETDDFSAQEIVAKIITWENNHG